MQRNAIAGSPELQQSVLEHSDLREFNADVSDHRDVDVVMLTGHDGLTPIRRW